MFAAWRDAVAEGLRRGRAAAFLLVSLMLFAHGGIVAAQVLLPDAAPILDVTSEGQVFAVSLPYGPSEPSAPTFVGGLFDNVSGTPVRNFAKVNSDGTPDPAWIHRFDGEVRAIAVNSDGSVFVGGNFFKVGDTDLGRLARFHSDGTLDTSWDVSVDGGPIHALLMDVANQRLYVGGGFNYIDVGGASYPRFGGLARFNIVSGVPVFDAGWNPGGADTGEVFALALDAGRNAVYAGGRFQSWGVGTSVHVKNLVRLSISTALPDATFNPEPNDVVNALALDSNAIYVGGNFSLIGGQPRARLARLMISGTPTSWNPGSDGPVLAIHAHASGLWVGGNFQQVGGMTLPYLARFANLGTATPDGINRGVNAAVRAIRQVGVYSAMRIGGHFSEGMGQQCFALLRLSNSDTAQTCADVGMRAEVNALAATGDGRWLFGGTFKRVNGQPIRYLGRTTPEGNLDTAWNPGPDAAVLAIATSAGTAVVGGQFTSVGGNSRSRLAKFDAAGTLDPQWVPAANAAVHSLLIDGATHVFAGGAFTEINAAARTSVVRLSLAGVGNIDTGFAPDALNGAVLAMALDSTPSGRLYLGGEFRISTSSGLSRLARFNRLTGVRDTGWSPMANNTVRALALDVPGNGIYVGGSFTSLGNYSSWNRLGKVRLSTSETDAVNFPAPGLPNVSDTIHSLHLGQDDALYVGGQFTSLSDLGQAFVARYTFDAGGKATIDSGWRPEPRDLGGSSFNDTAIIRAVTRDAFGTVGIGGRFRTVGGLSRMGTAFFTDAGTVTLRYSAGPNGSISGEALQQVPFGESGTPVTAMADPGHHFISWSDSNVANPRTDVGVMDDVDVTAHFAAYSYTLGGQVSGLLGSGLVLSTGAQTLPISSAGAFQFLAPLPSGSAYAVLVAGQPHGPAQTCSVAHGSGTVVAADITDVEITCVTRTHAVTLAPGANGALAMAAGHGFPLTAVPDGQVVAIDVLPDAGYAIGHVSGCDGSLSGSVYTTAAITSDCPVSASFALATRTVDLSAAITADPAAGMPGEVVEFRVTLHNAGPDHSEMATINAAPFDAWENVSWRCEPSESTAPCPGPEEGSGALTTFANLMAGSSLTYSFTGVLTGSAPQARLAVGISAGSNESDTVPANNSATGVVQIQGPLFSDGFEGSAPSRIP